MLDTGLIFGDVLVDREKKYLGFTGPGFTVAIARCTLVRNAAIRRLISDVSASVDADGLHIPWRGGRGGLKLEASHDHSRRRRPCPDGRPAAGGGRPPFRRVARGRAPGDRLGHLTRPPAAPASEHVEAQQSNPLAVN